MVRAAGARRRIGLSFHVAAEPAIGRKARMVVLPGAATAVSRRCPGGRVNVGIVLAGRSWRDSARGRGRGRGRAGRARGDPADRRRPRAWRDGAITDAIAGAARSAAAWSGARVPAGCSSATRPGSSTRSPARACTARSCRRGWRRPRSTRDLAGGAAARSPTTTARCAPVPGKDLVSRARPGVPRPARAARLRRPAAGAPGRRPCDDGPRDGRPRPRLPRPRPAVPRRPLCRRDRAPQPASTRTRARGVRGSAARRRRAAVPGLRARTIWAAGQLDAARRRARLRRGPGRRRAARAARGDRPDRHVGELLGVRSAILEPDDDHARRPAPRGRRPLPRRDRSRPSCATSPTARPTAPHGSGSPSWTRCRSAPSSGSANGSRRR